MTHRRTTSRRDFLRLGLAAGPASLAAACGWDGGPWLEPKLRAFSRVNDWVGEHILLSTTRLAPEYPFPAAVHDARFAFDWTVEHADLLGIDAARIALGGDSAGGNLSLVTALALRDAGGTQPRFLLLVYPSTEIVSARPSRQRYADGYMLDRGTLAWFFARYLPEGNGEDWRASPMRAASLAGLPPMLLVGAEFDPLVDDCAAFAERVRAEGGEVDYREIPGVIHGFLTLGKLIPESAPTVALAGEALRAALGAGIAKVPG